MSYKLSVAFGCAHKASYPTERKAKNGAGRAMRKYGQFTSYYKCKHCSKYHLTSTRTL